MKTITQLKSSKYMLTFFMENFKQVHSKGNTIINNIFNLCFVLFWLDLEVSVNGLP